MGHLERGRGRKVLSLRAYESRHVYAKWKHRIRYVGRTSETVASTDHPTQANDQGNAILFEPSTSEHVSARTIFDPITAIAPAADCRTFAIGYLNGSILIATLQPSFTILHTLNTTRSPSRITDLAWHGSSSKQKTDMLATQTSDGDLRVWSVPKIAHGELPNIIRVLQRPDLQQRGPCWFAWSKNGRIVQYADG